MLLADHAFAPLNSRDRHMSFSALYQLAADGIELFAFRASIYKGKGMRADGLLAQQYSSSPYLASTYFLPGTLLGRHTMHRLSVMLVVEMLKRNFAPEYRRQTWPLHRRSKQRFSRTPSPGQQGPACMHGDTGVPPSLGASTIADLHMHVRDLDQNPGA